VREEDQATDPPPPMFGHFRTLLHPDGSPFILGKSRDGISYKAIDMQLARPVTLKVISRDLLSSHEAKQRFRRNARSAASIRHPNVATIFEVRAEGDHCYVVAEFPEGEDLERYVASNGPLSPAAALRVVSQVAQALEAFQAKELVHGNIKPSNMVATDRSGELQVKLTDFDLVKVEGIETPESAEGSTVEIFIGSPAFASPEQCDSKKLDIRSDIYSLGVTLWYLLSGKLPFTGSVAQIAVGHMSKPPPFDELTPVPVPLLGLLVRMLEKTPNNRFQGPAELQSAIERLAVQLPSSKSGLPLSPDESRAGPPPNLSVSDRAATGMQAPACPSPLAEAGKSSDAPEPALPILADENIQFKVYRPATLQAGRWHRMLVFTHIDESVDQSPDQPTPVEKIEEIAQRILADDFHTYRHFEAESALSIPRESEITLVPEAKGISFNPRRRSFIWAEGLRVHDESFLLMAPANLVGSLVHGRLSVFLGHLLLADITLNFRIISDAPAGPSPAASGWDWSTARPFRKVFASYSHKDVRIVESMEQQVKALGYEYLRDVVNLRSGSIWSEALQRMIDAADIFQLFWSSNSSDSKYVEQEWRYALTLRRPAFIRPTFWQEPMPPAPEALSDIQFYRLPALVPLDAEEIETARPAAQPTGLSAERMAAPIEPADQVRESQPIPHTAYPSSAPRPTRPTKGIGRLAAIVTCIAGVFLIMVITLPFALNQRVGSTRSQAGVMATPITAAKPPASPSVTATSTPDAVSGGRR
jgi:serine/threonine protein kinase